MLKRSFFKLLTPKLYYSSPKQDISIKEIPLPSRAFILVEKDCVRVAELYEYVGKMVKTGQKIDLSEISFISPVTGTIKEFSEYTDYLNKQYYSLMVETSEDEWVKNDFIPPSIPGLKNVGYLTSFDPPVNHVLIMGVDTDLFVITNQLALKERTRDVEKGIKYIYEIAKIGEVEFIISPELVSYVEPLGYKFYVIKSKYPNHLPKLIIKNIFKKILPAGKEPRDMGMEFLSSEAVANMGALAEGKLILDKLITVINKDYSTICVKARIGTPVGHILDTLGIEVSEGDRIIIGGPMRGKTIYSLDSPVDYETDAIFIQDKNEVIHTSDNHCINCGECIRVCPVNVPVNMLVRVLENGLFEEAVNEYDLLSCIECGLCSYVCIARIPVFHYIMLGKHEFFKMRDENA